MEAKLDKQLLAQRGRGLKDIKGQLAEPLVILETSYQEQITESAFEETELREHLYHRIRLIKDFSIILQRFISDGQLAEADIKRMAQIDAGKIKEFF